MPMTESEMRDAVPFLDAHLQALHTEAEGRALTEDEQTRFDEGLALRETFTATLEQIEARHAAIGALRTIPEVRAEHGDGAINGQFNINTRKNADVFDLSEVRTMPGSREFGSEVRGRAFKAIEDAPYMTDEHRESATKLVEHDVQRGVHGDKARYILEHGSADYHERFQTYMSTRNMGFAMQGLDQRAAMTLTGANGGYLVPFTLDPTIILTNNGATDPFREISRVVSITTDDWNGVSSAGVTAEWIAEATEVADASPTFAQPSITVHKADAYVQGSLEVIADASLSGEIAGLIADAKFRLEATAHATGSGSGQPYGIVTALGLTTASRVAGSSGAAGAADYVVGDVYALANALPPRHRDGAKWVAEYSTWNRTRQFATGSGPNHAFWADLGMDTPSLLLGKPIYESSAFDSTLVSGSNDDIIVLGEFNPNYVLVDRMGMELVFNPLVLGSNRRPTGEQAWVAFWRHGADSVNDNAFRMLRV